MSELKHIINDTDDSVNLSSVIDDIKLEREKNKILEKKVEELELDIKVKQNYIDNAGDLEKKIESLEAKELGLHAYANDLQTEIDNIKTLLKKKTERIVELEKKNESN